MSGVVCQRCVPDSTGRESDEEGRNHRGDGDGEAQAAAQEITEKKRNPNPKADADATVEAPPFSWDQCHKVMLVWVGDQNSCPQHVGVK